MHDDEKLIHDLTQSVKIAQEERAKADALFLSIGEGAIATNDAAKIDRINQAALDLLGFEEDELLGKWYPNAIRAYDADGNLIATMQRPITQAFLSGTSVSRRIFVERKDGSRLPVAMTISPVLLGKKPIGAIAVFRDISEELEIDRMKSEFIAIASHQLRTPLTAIKLDAHMLQEGYVGDLTPEQRTQVKMILFSIDRMEELISTLLNITRIEAGRIAITPKPTQLERIIRLIVKELSSGAREKNIVITINSQKNLPRIVTDKLLVREVCANLLSNAIKYSPEESRITVNIHEEGDCVVFSVADTGYGIPDDAQERVFTKFYRGSNIKQKEAIGTGLGLYMIKGVVDNLKGRIWFDSNVDHGTTFYVSLPITGPLPRQGNTTIEPTVVASSSGTTAQV